jgi:hypothetical protein
MPIEAPGLSGTGPTLTVVDPSGAPSNILDADQPFQIVVDWSISASTALTLGSGNWSVSVYAESQGPGPERQVGTTVTVPLTGGTNFSATVNVPAGQLPAESTTPQRSGVYKLVTIINHQNGLVPPQDTEVSGFEELPIIRMRQP